MKRTLTTLIASIGLTGAAMAGGNHTAQYQDYVDSIGDPTPMSYKNWMQVNGYAKLSDTPREALTEKEQEYLQFTNSYGDGSAPSFAAWSGQSEPGMSERKKLSPMEQRYLAYASSFGDSTPPSFAEWKSGLPSYSDTQYADNTHE